MGDNKGEATAGGMKIDSALVRELAELLAETGLTEIEVEDGERKIKVARMLSAPAAFAPTVSVPAPTNSPAGVPAEAAPAVHAAEQGDMIKSPMVGTAYLSAEPGSAPFVGIGQQVKAGETLLIVEAMKVMNPIVAPLAGTIKSILVDNAQPVEFDQPLVVIG